MTAVLYLDALHPDARHLAVFAFGRTASRHDRRVHRVQPRAVSDGDGDAAVAVA